MPYVTFKNIGGLEIRACFMDICLVDGTTSKPPGMVRDMMINIDGFEFEIDVIVSKDNKDQDCPRILGRSSMATTKSLVDLELNEVFIRSNSYHKCYKVNPPPKAYILAIKIADDWEAFKALI